MRWCELGPGSVADGVLTATCKGDAVDEDGTATDYGSAPMMCALGLSASPYQATDEGCAEGLVDDGVAGQLGVIIAARDARSAKIVGKLGPGDTVCHSTGPRQCSQLQLKETGQAALLTKTSGGKTMMLLLDGDLEEVQLTHAGAIFKIDKNGSITITEAGGAGILLQNGAVHLLGNRVIGAGNPPGFGFALVPLTGSPGGIASTPLLVAQGVTPG